MNAPSAGAKPLTATARLQFHKDFTLADAEALVPYLDDLGISHLYASPLLAARAGSTHGYDIVDHNRINPELGGEDALRTLVTRLRAHGMGLILDIVPNHMGVGGNDNTWWMDVLEWGRASPYAEYFDIDWDPADASLHGRLLAPFLGKSYGDCLQDNELQLQFDAATGRFYVAYFDHHYPIAPRDYAAILLTGGGILEAPARRFNELDGDTARAAAAEARRELRLPTYATAIAETLRAYDTRTPAGQDRLHRLLERQSFRLSWWRAATDEINWRRFFDVNGLAGVRVEIPAVFEDTHRTVFRLYEEGLIDGVRIDHVDGLAYPREYCRKLRRRLDAITPRRPAGLDTQPAILWVEKILFAHERLDPAWHTDGTTGYDFMNDVAALLHDPFGETPLTELWTETTGRPAAFATEAQAARNQVLRENLSSELGAVAAALHRVAKRDLRTRDYTFFGIRLTLIELLVHFHTYRIYAGPGGIAEADRRAMDWAMAGARRTVRASDRDLLEHVAAWVCGTGLDSLPPGTRRAEWLRAMVKFQQLSAPAAAKSVEDTAFYRYGRLISRNEVGSEPSQFALTPAGFHAVSEYRQHTFPTALLATATHDHKRGEDTRMRMAMLSGLPAEWAAATADWMRANALPDPEHGTRTPDAADELMLYQTLVAAWPPTLRPDDAAGLEDYRARVAAWLEKALREAKRHSGWVAPNEHYEAASAALLARCLDPARPMPAALAAFANRLAPAGIVSSLSQTILRLTTPGIPDLYQGTDFWDFSLVDPDNRRPVDYAARQAALATGAEPADLLADWTNGHVKQAIIARLLALRARLPELFARGGYTPLATEGPNADHLFAFARTLGTKSVIVAVTRCPLALPMAEPPLVTPAGWDATAIVIPRSMVGTRSEGILDRAWSRALPERIDAGQMLARLPGAVMEIE